MRSPMAAASSTAAVVESTYAVYTSSSNRTLLMKTKQFIGGSGRCMLGALARDAEGLAHNRSPSARISRARPRAITGTSSTARASPPAPVAAHHPSPGLIPVVSHHPEHVLPLASLLVGGNNGFLALIPRPSRAALYFRHSGSRPAAARCASRTARLSRRTAPAADMASTRVARSSPATPSRPGQVCRSPSRPSRTAATRVATATRRRGRHQLLFSWTAA